MKITPHWLSVELMTSIYWENITSCFPSYKMFVSWIIQVFSHPKMLRGVMCCYFNTCEVTTMSQTNAKVETVQVTIPISIGTYVCTNFITTSKKVMQYKLTGRSDRKPNHTPTHTYTDAVTHVRVYTHRHTHTHTHTYLHIRVHHTLYFFVWLPCVCPLHASPC